MIYAMKALTELFWIKAFENFFNNTQHPTLKDFFNHFMKI